MLKPSNGSGSTLINPALDEHGGRIVKTGSDSLLIVFEIIDGAVRCAVKVQQQVPILDASQPSDRAIRFRVGLTLVMLLPMELISTEMR